MCYGQRGEVTFLTEGSSVGREAAVTGEACVPLHTAATVLAQAPIAAAVSRTAGPHTGGDLRPLLQVQRLPVQLQGSDASQESLLSRCRPP